MLFIHDTEVSLACAAALVNTDGADRDALSTPAELDEFVAAWEFTGNRTHDHAELQAVRELRSRLRQAWHTDTDGMVDLVNALLREGQALPQLVRHDHWDYHVHATSPDQPLATRMAVEAAMGLIDVIRSGQTGRLRICAAEGCADVLVDLSRNRSKRYCSITCGNRENVAAYRARRGATG